MTKRMLIDATHKEETRVAVIDGNRLVEFDYESKLRKQLKGSIFLAKVTRVEPSLQAAFVNFGGNRHGFLPFSEIHPDYFRIPVSDREALLAEQKEALEAAIAAEEAAIAEEEAAYARALARERGEDVPAEDENAGDLGHPDVVTLDPSLPLAHSEPDDAELVAGADEDGAGAGDDDDDADVGSETDIEADSADAEFDPDDAGEIDDAEFDAEADSANEGTDSDAAEARPVHKLVYKGVTEIDPETFEIKTLHDTESFGFEHELASKIEELAKSRDDVLRVRLHHRNDQDGKEIRSVWVALREDNLDVDLELVDENDEREGGRDGRRGRGRGRGRFRNGRDGGRDGRRGRGRGRGNGRFAMQNRQVEVLGGDGVDSDQPFRPSLHRNYKIQEVIKRGQIMLIQVQKEERGNKGAAVTTYLSLPGRYCVLMPNSPRGGGVSRKIASFAERKRMREILSDLSVPDGMSVILRTAGVAREQDEIKRDLDYLMRLWDNIRDLTLQSSAPAMIYEESNLVKRSVRDIYANDIEDIWVSGDEGYREAKNFMKLLMPSHADNVHHYTDAKIPLFHRYQVENQIAEIGESVVNLRSGGYLVINPTEALVSIDVNSGRATKERHIEETALKTNLEAAEEVARQLRLRDLGGLVVIDFIDMEDFRNNAKVERRLRDALSSDRARIQVGRISSFGLLELSRQRLNPSLTEAQFERCPHCKGVGFIRSVDSSTILALRSLEEEGIRNRASQVILSVPNSVALYILNQKREMLADIERRYGFTVFIRVDESLAPTGFKLDPVKGIASVDGGDRAARMSADDEDADASVADEATDLVEAAPSDDEGASPREGGRRGRGRERSRRGRGARDGRGDRDAAASAPAADAAAVDADGVMVESVSSDGQGDGADDGSPSASSREGRDGARRGRGRERSRRGRGGRDRDGAPREAEDGVAGTRGEGETVGASASDVEPRASDSAPAEKFRTKRFSSRKNAGADVVASDEVAPVAGAAEGVSIVTSSPSNDAATDSGPKKKGWWNRLTQK